MKILKVVFDTRVESTLRKSSIKVGQAKSQTPPSPGAPTASLQSWRAVSLTAECMLQPNAMHLIEGLCFISARSRACLSARLPNNTPGLLLPPSWSNLSNVCLRTPTL